jgi:hypothetical protein
VRTAIDDLIVAERLLTQVREKGEDAMSDDEKIRMAHVLALIALARKRVP